ncbi:restriction endonuclease subunit S [bacterium M00.F.Ca.ET.228.01.1.1]|nr:restriction endonuclease subunit S [bacterium M00.F.Ca.ET.228.01.1.1]TGR96697.1 restriction endonuclease subunit S [bacterium M00.F.Ca.ET.191.01.1.1]TGT97964.1 restriction endonuclease subunit S [bacterium M00.F.Ca.ET.155.01.1.1]
MSLPRYPQYKDSGVAWLGQVPGHWQVRRLGFYFNERREKVSDKDYPALSVTKAGIVPQLETAAKTDNGDNRKKVCTGDFVINSRSDRKGSAGMSRLEGSVSLINTVLQPTSGIDIEYAHHLLKSVPFQEEFYRYGKGIVADLWSTNYSEMRNIVLALPSLEEQAAIAALLDRETDKIGALIAEQEKLLALLAEKRLATISHAVTRGLNPDAPMKDSGVEWLGEVPAHWDVVPLMHLTHCSRPIMYGIVLPGPNVDTGIPIVKGGDVKEHRLRLELLNRTTAEIEAPYARARLRPLDIVYSIRGTIGDAEVVPDELVDANITQDVARISPASGIQTRWLLHVMKSRPVFVQLEQRSLGAAVRGINIFELKRARIPVPPSKEREAIAAFLDAETTKVDTLKAEAEHAIELLKERRSALIAAAVTGKIDVRDAVPQELAA